MQNKKIIQYSNSKNLILINGIEMNWSIVIDIK